MITVVAAVVVGVLTFFVSGVLLVLTLTWALFEIPGSPWPRLCDSNAPFTSVPPRTTDRRSRWCRSW